MLQIQILSKYKPKKDFCGSVVFDIRQNPFIMPTVCKS